MSEIQQQTILQQNELQKHQKPERINSEQQECLERNDVRSTPLRTATVENNNCIENSKDTSVTNCDIKKSETGTGENTIPETKDSNGTIPSGKIVEAVKKSKENNDIRTNSSVENPLTTSESLGLKENSSNSNNSDNYNHISSIRGTVSENKEDSGSNALKSPTKSILTNGNISSSRRGSKKSVSFEPNDEAIKKFTDGEVIVDKRNPFKNGAVIEPASLPAGHSDRKLIIKIRKGNSSNEKSTKVNEDCEFISTEEVLKESKFVKTYIKNPDKYFTYDPAILARLKFEELHELRDKKPPRRVRLSVQTQERLKELQKPKQSSQNNTKIPSYKKVSKSNYPDLSQIKVKTGTDLEDSLFNPEEVTINAKKFDERVKKLHISSDDDLEEIDEPLTKSDSSEELQVPSVNDNNSDMVDSIPSSETKIDITTKTTANSFNSKDENKSFTNTVNSKEFQDYLEKKGLSLTPKEKAANGKVKNLEKGNKLKSAPSTLEMEPKKTKKPSMFQRLLPSGIFSSKRKTTPKEQVPTPQNVYIKGDSVDKKTSMNSSTNPSTTSSSIKRVILERQSFHGGSICSNNPTSIANDLRRQIEKSRKSYAGDDRSSSISSALTNAEEFGDMNSLNSSINLTAMGQTSSTRSSNETLVGSIGGKSNRSRMPTATISKERLHNFQGKCAEVRDGIVKPRVQRAAIPINVLKPLSSISKSSHSGEKLEKDKSPQSTSVKRSTIERQNSIQKKSSYNAEDSIGSFGRICSMDRQEITKRSQLRLNNSSQSKSSRNSTGSQKSMITPKASKEDLLDGSGPKLTSTPINESEKQHVKQKVSVNQKIASPIVAGAVCSLTKIEPPAPFNVGPAEWIKLREIKEKTDKELFTRVTQAQIKNSENIYEKLPSQPQAQIQVRKVISPPPVLSAQVTTNNHQPLYAQLIPEGSFIRASPQRSTISTPYGNRNAKIIDGAAINMPDKHNGIPVETSSIKVQSTLIQPPRCQSVLDEMMVPRSQQQYQYSQPIYGSVSGTPVVMRRKETPSLTREEILQKVKEFCRKSMNKTPTKLSNNNIESHHKLSNGKVPSDISPVSYASVEYQNTNGNGKYLPGKILAPQVPQRVQSLQEPPPHTQPSPQTPSNSPIYAHVIKRNSIQSNVSDTMYDSSPQKYFNRLRASIASGGGGGSGGAASDTESVFLPGNPSSPSSSSNRYLIMDSEKVTPVHVMKYRNEVYGQIIPNPYGYIQLNSNTNINPQNHRVSQSRVRIDNTGRTTPLILERTQASPIIWNTAQQNPTTTGHFNQRSSQQPQSLQLQAQQHAANPNGPNGNIVYLKVKDQIYKPITTTAAATTTNTSDRYYHNIPTSNYHFKQHTLNTGKPIQQYTSARFYPYESESGSEAGEVQRILQSKKFEEDWQNDKSGRSQSNEQATDDRRRAARREDPRRHTLGGDMLQYGGQGQPQQRAMDLEMGTRAQKPKKAPPIRGYTPINQGPLFDEDPGIMSEVETASTGFRRGGKQRSSLPVVRTPSKTLERPLGLVFLQYRSETKRALLPNEITSIDTVRALFVRSFPRQLTMAYLEGPNVKIYIHDPSKDMFYELEDVRSHLREIRDRSVLRLFESNEVAAPQVLPGGPGVPQPLPPPAVPPGHWDQDQSYFSEPEFDSEYQHQHIHKSKSGKPAPYYVGSTQTLPHRGIYSDRTKNAVGAPAKPLRSYGSRGSMGPPFPYPPDQLYSIPVDGYTSSPERGTRSGYEEPYYSQYGTRGSTVAPIIDEEQRCYSSEFIFSTEALTEDQYAMYGMKVAGRIPRTPNQMYDPTRPEDLHRIRVEHMERQLANLTGLVQKALNQNPPVAGPVGAINTNYLGVPGQCRGLDDMDGHSSGSSTSIQDKSVSFEKSVSFSDDIQGVPKSHSPQHAADSKPPKPAIKSSTLPRTSSQERDRLKPPPPPKPLALASTHPNYRPDIALAPEVYNHLRGLQKKAKDLRMEVRTLRRLSQAQAVAVREDIKDAFMRIRATLLASGGNYWGQGDVERTRMSREEEIYKQEVIRLEKDLGDLEASVEGLRGEVINRRTRVNMAAVEDMALVLSRASKTVAELKMRFPGLQQGLRNILANEMDKVVREEKFLKDEPDRLESALRRCKKLTGTLVTLKRLASVQEQRLPVNEPVNEDPPRSAEISSANKPIPSPRMGSISVSGGIPPENALDALLDELQTFAKPQSLSNDNRPDDSTSDDSSQNLQNTVTTQLSQSSLYPANMSNDPLQQNQQQQSNMMGPSIICNNNNNNILSGSTLSTNIGSLRRLHSYPSGSDTDTSPPQPSRPVGKPPVPERNADLLSKVSNKRIPPPPPPRTSSRSPLASPTSPNVPHRLPSVSESDSQLSICGGPFDIGSTTGGTNNNDSGNDHVQRQLALEMRHQELLRKQKLLQEQYARLQAMSKNSIALPPSDILQLKKTGSESNLPQKMGLSMTVTGSMKNLNSELIVAEKNERNLQSSNVTLSNMKGTSSSSSSNEESCIAVNKVNQSGSSTDAGATAAPTATTKSETTGETNSSATAGGQTTTNKVYETDIL